MDSKRDHLHAALAKVLAHRKHLDGVRDQLRGRAGEQLDTMPGALKHAEQSQDVNPNILVHRRHVGLLDEQAKLNRLHADLSE